jgi:hypothetical protein
LGKARGDFLKRVGDALDMRGRVAAAAAGDVEPALLREVEHEGPHVLRQKREAGGRERVGQAGVGVAAEVASGQARELLDIGPHLVRPERAVDSDAQRLGVRHGNPERLERLRVERAAGIEDGDGDHQRHAAAKLQERLLDGEERGLGVERVENRLDQQHVGAALDQAERLLTVGVDQFDVGDAARAGIVRVARDGGGTVGRTHRAGDEADAAGIRRHELVAHPRSQPGGLDVELGNDVLKVIVGLRDGLRVEGVGLDDVGASLEELAVDAGDDVGSRQGEQIAITLQQLVMILEALAAEIFLLELVLLQGGAHGAVDDDDALLQQGFEGMEVAHGSGKENAGIWAESHRRTFLELLNISTYVDGSMGY